MQKILSPAFSADRFFSQEQSSNQLGALGERVVIEALTKLGYIARPSSRTRGEKFDIWAKNNQTGEVIRVEVKTSRRSKEGKYRFLLYRKGKQDHSYADYVILLALTMTGYLGVFVVPQVVLANQHQAVITSHPLRYAGKLARYRRSLDDLGLT